jgi:hypothetical protein
LVNHGPGHQHHYQCHQHVNGIEQNVNHILTIITLLPFYSLR